MTEDEADVGETIRLDPRLRSLRKRDGPHTVDVETLARIAARVVSAR